MPFANNQRTRIHYATEGRGSPIVLQYGQYFPLEIWYELNYVDALRNDYQLILIDARGHGDSDKPHDPEAYRIELMVQDILSVLDDLNLEKAHYMGYSSGGYLGFGMAKFAPERIYSLILGGTHPYPDDDPEADAAWRNEQIQMLEKQNAADFLANIEQFLSTVNLPPLSPRMRAGMLKHDTRALIAWLKKSSRWPTFEDMVGGISVPCLLYVGEKDGGYLQAQKAVSEIRNASFVGIPNGGHLEGGTWIKILTPYIDHIVKSTGAP